MYESLFYIDDMSMLGNVLTMFVNVVSDYHEDSCEYFMEKTPNCFFSLRDILPVVPFSGMS